MRTTVLVTAAATALALAFAPVSTDPRPTAGGPSGVFEPAGTYGDEHDCLQLTPASTSTAALTGGEGINLHVHLVLDVAEGRQLDATTGDRRQQAIDAFGRQLVADHLDAGVQSYAEIEIDLDYASFDLLETDDLRSGERAPRLEGQEAIDIAKAQYGGTRPPGTDVVYVLSDRDLTLDGNAGLAGLADCIGGVAHPDRAFATGELDRDAEFSLGVSFYAEYTAKVAAHEVGHLMGAHHHYQACGPYAATNHLDGHGAGACTLMTNFVDFVTFPFSPTNQVVVRGHAEDHATANDH